MSHSDLLHSTWASLPWLVAGTLAGLWLVPLARLIPQRVLQGAQADLQEWQGPGGGLERPAPEARRIWVPMLNAALWGFSANPTSQPEFWSALLGACLASALLLLALIDWDTTLLPDWIVLPLGAAGLGASHAGLTGHSLLASAASAALVLFVLGVPAWLFQRLRGARGLGGGDLKLLAALAAWWGVVSVLYVVLGASLLTVVWNLAWRRFKGLDPEAEWPFGPAIVAAALVVWSM
ncbi:MAG: prepilin peptidase [Chlorobiaceae bacterium]|nr:prepilin peptidase [Chlorobiaceae bacterium]